MPKSYRIRTQVGVDKSIKVQLDQEFEFLEILSLKLLQSQIYTRPCSDYGVVVGRVSVNDGFGLPNCKVSVFIPLTNDDSTNPIIADLYPYKSLTQLNEDGYRYNLLPYVPSYSVHKATGTFFTREDVLTNPTLIEVFDKYYKYTAITNDSGDFMIFGVPVGTQILHLDVDLSDIGEFSLSPQDLIRMGRATESQVAGTEFKSSSNLGNLPQIVTINRTVEVEPLWGQPEICNLGITRSDFDLTEEANILIEPTSIFMGSIFSDTDRMALKANCKPRFKQGELCNLVAGPGEILAIRQTIFQDINGRPLLETVDLDQGGQVIDENGAWLIDVPMNLDYVITNEFGEQVLSNDPKKGIPTKGKYRFKVKWNQSPSLSENIRRAYFLVPNVREYGWDQGGNSVIDLILRRKSYSFSLDWDDYADVQSAIDCDDTFYYMSYNKVYSVSQLIDQYRNGILPNRFLSLKNILDDTCESENNRFPTNDTVFRLDIIYLLFLFALIVFRPILYALIFILHVLFIVVWVLRIFMPLLAGYVVYLSVLEFISAGTSFPALGLIISFAAKGLAYLLLGAALIALQVYLWKLKLKGISLPVLLYDQCEFCDCKNPDDLTDEELDDGSGSVSQPQIKISPSGLQISQFQTANYNMDEVADDPLYLLQTRLMTGQEFGTPPVTDIICSTKVPGLLNGSDKNGDNWWYTTTSLTIPERINLFNTKAKYFDDHPFTNPGGGVNRIKVSFNPGTVLEHYDNITFMMLTPESASSLKAGDMITFQNSSLSLDINTTGATENQFGNRAITGTSLNTSTKTIYFADFNNPGTNTSVTYTFLPPDPKNTDYHKFPIDIEYFQVITAMTYSQFYSLNGNTLTNSLDKRFLNNDMSFLQIQEDSPAATANASIRILNNPLTSFDKYENQTCVFLVRGVDPYSTRQKIEYDLSRIFGYNSWGNIIISGNNYKLNQPIVGGFLNINHTLSNNDDLDSYSNSYLYFENFTYQPSNQFSGFSSNLPSYYSILDNNLTTAGYTCSCDLDVSDGSNIDNVYGRRVRTDQILNNDLITQNSFTTEYNVPQTNYYSATYNINPNNRGYFVNEIIEGGTLMIMSAELKLVGVLSDPEVETAYISKTYPTSLNINYPQAIVNNRKTVMRSDRLPSSTQNNENCGSNYILQNNQSFGLYLVPDEGILGQSTQGGLASMSQGESDKLYFSSQTMGNELIDSLNNCKDSVPLRCYDYANNEFFIKSGDDCKTANNKSIWNKGCYILITKVLVSIPIDLEILTEWLARTNITFGACRNVFSHTFTNNWINGSLYAFAFKQNITFNNLNQPTSDRCTAVVYFDSNTNNFYYRSSPYYSGNTQQYFCGSPSPNNSNQVQKNNLKYPTTLIDLGPRSSYLQEIVMSDDYDGYVINRINTTTFGDVTDLLNIFIISRLANSNFVALIFGTQGANILNYFNKRRRLQVDADYAQMISINSELGVAEFDSQSYPAIPNAQDPIYFNGGDVADGVFGIFFSSDTQIRDFITPKRTIISPTNSPTPINGCTYSYFNGFSQNVPFYQWEIKTNNDIDNIFGSQSNTWFTEPIDSNSFFANDYQKMDRVNITSSRYFQTVLGLNNQSYLKGYIWGVDTNGNYTATPGSQQLNNMYPNLGKTITVGAPFHFYFGLKKGGSAWDRFAKKWIKFETITD